MLVSRTLCAFGAGALAALAAAPAYAAGSPEGVWINDTGRGAVEIKSCGQALCGHVVWVKDTTDTKGCGKQIIGDVSLQGGSAWGGGWVYSPEKKKRYDVELTPLDGGKLRVVGFAGIKLFSKTMIWKRAPDDLVRCGTVEAAAKPAGPVKPPEPAAAGKPDAAAPQVNKVEPPAGKTAPVIDNSQTAKSETVLETKKAEAPVPAAEAPIEPQPPATDGEDDAASEADSETGTGDLKLGDFDLGKVLTRTKGGNCKLDLPWVKIEIGCE